MIEIPNNPQQNSIKSEIPNNKNLNKWELLGFAWELGYIIALPIAILGIGGKWLDTRWHHNFPWVTLIGIGLAILTTTLWLVKRLKRYIK